MKGISVTKFFNAKFKNIVKTMGRLSNEYIPEHLFKMVIINANFVFRGLYKIMKMWIDPNTRKRIFVYGNDF